MEGKTFRKLIQDIEDFVFIEEKIVTCLWLCQTLKVHINTSKQLLHAFLNEDGVKDKVSVTYIVGGHLKDGQGIKLQLVDGVKREETKNLFSNLSTDHIYSIQKSASSINSADIFNSYPHFNFNPDDRKFCSVKPSKEIEKREIKKVIVEAKKEISKAQSKTSSKPSEENDSRKHKSSNGTQEPTSKQKKTNSPEKTTKAKVTKGGIADMFSKQTEKKKADPLPNNDKKVEKKKSGPISNFFQSQPAKKQHTDSEPMDVDSDPLPIKETNKKVESIAKADPVTKDEKNPIRNGIDDSQKSSGKEKKPKGKENRKKRKKRDETEDDSRKKRKRIATVFSSDSEASENEMSECELEPEPQPVVEIPQKEDDEEEDIIPPTPGRKRIRKQIDKTYTDEDGYILTKKEYVYESCTDDEEAGEKSIELKKTEKSIELKKTSDKEQQIEKVIKSPKEEKPKKSNKKSPVKKKSPSNDKTNNKQASIMSFFKKK